MFGTVFPSKHGKYGAVYEESIMQPFEHPETTMLIHETLVKEEMERHQSKEGWEARRIGSIRKPGTAIRTRIGQALVTIGTRIDPESRSATSSVSTGDTSLATPD